MFVYHGSGNTGLGGNAYVLYMRVHEASYLLGRLAGQLTETDRVGSVGTFAYDDVNDELNAFFQGARDVNPDVQVTVSFIESWYDPGLGAGAAVAGSLRLGEGWEACVSNDIMCFGNFGDQNFLAPENAPASTMAL